MKVLISGTAGRIGRTIAVNLLDRGDHIIGYDVMETPIEHSNFTPIVGDLADAETVMNACDGAEAVLHIGAFMSWVAADEPRIFQANVTGTLNILTAAKALAVKRFVYASSGEVYPDGNPTYLPIDEEHPKLPSSPYGLSKLMGEEAVQYYGRNHNLPYVILRFSHTQDAEELLDENSFFSGAEPVNDFETPTVSIY